MKNSIEKIDKLSKLFKKYNIYPRSCYDFKTPARIFQKLYPDNHYSLELEQVLSDQDYSHSKRGADLPWWGEKYFSDEEGRRILIVSQDSLVPDAGSIAFFAQLFPVIDIDDVDSYKKFESNLVKSGNSFCNSWNTVKKLFTEWGIDFDFLYITDASKVYSDNSWDDFDFNTEKSLELLKSEIEICNPDLIILLGRTPFLLLDKNHAKNYSDITKNGKIIKIMDKRCIVSPFPIGCGRTQKDFKLKIEKVRKLLSEIK